MRFLRFFARVTWGRSPLHRYITIEQTTITSPVVLYLLPLDLLSLRSRFLFFYLLYFSHFFCVTIVSFYFPFIVLLLLLSLFFFHILPIFLTLFLFSFFFPFKFSLCLAILLLCVHLLNHKSFHLLIYILLHAPLCLPFFHIKGTSHFLFPFYS